VTVIPTQYNKEYILIKITHLDILGIWMDKVKGKFHYSGLNQVIYDETSATRFTGTVGLITTSPQEAATWWKMYNN
jgi:hypothetical protein